MARIHYRRRFIKGLHVALRILISYKIAKITGVFRSGESKESHLKELHRRNAVMFRKEAIRMKGVMIKVGQFLSSRIDFLPDEYVLELSGLQDRVPPCEYAAIRRQIIDSLGAPPEGIFAGFEEKPIAAASLGQVHRGVLADGRDVAVKVQYPDIDKVIETDIRMFGVLIRLLHGRYGHINLRVLHEEFSRIIRAELDYIQEGKNAERFRDNFSGDARIIIPSVQWEYTKGKVLTLEFVEGIKITDCGAVKAAGIDCRQVVNLLAESYSKMIFVHGFFHGDPHPGNIFIREGPKLIYVDFGMVQAMPEAIKRELRRFANAVVESNARGIIESMEAMGFIIEGADYDALTGVARSLIDKYRNISPSELKALTVDDVSQEISNVFGIVKYIQIPNNFILLGRTIGILNGIAFRLNPEINIIEIGKPYIKEFLRGGREEQTRQILNILKDGISDFVALPGQLKEFLTRANRGDLAFKISKPEIKEITGRFRALSSVMMLVILTVTMAASSLFFVLIESRAFSLITAGASVILGLLSVYRLMRY